MFSVSLSHRNSLMTALLLLAMLVALLAPSTASAGFSSCSGDPTFILSDGTLMTSSTYIKANASSVQSIAYTLHVPPGVLVIGVSWSLNLGLLGKEHVTVYNDAQPNQYITDAVVQTTATGVPVTAKTTVGLTAQSASGFNGQHLVLTFSR
jgi:hypothetical protein